MEEIDLLKKDNNLKNKEIINLKKELIEQNNLLNKENQILKEEIKQFKKNDENKPNTSLIHIDKVKNIDINKENKDISTKKNIKGKNLYLKIFKATNELFNKNPNELKYHSNIVKNLSAKGVNDIFEIFVCNKDNQVYLISKNAKTHNLDIISLNNNKIITSLKGHNNTIIMIRYFINYKGKNEYLILQI